MSLVERQARGGDGVDHLRCRIRERRPEREPGEVGSRLVEDLLPGGVIGIDRDVERHRVSLVGCDRASGSGIATGTEPEDHLPGARVELGRVVSERVGRARRSLWAGGDIQLLGRYVVPAGIASRITKFAAESEPVLV